MTKEDLHGDTAVSAERAGRDVERGLRGVPAGAPPSVAGRRGL